MKALDRNIWRSSISLQTKVRLYNVYILPILLYAADTWSMTAATSRRLDAFDQWCLRRILRIPYTAHVYKRGSEAQDWAATSHLYHRIKAITSIRTYRTSGSITRSFPCPSGSHQPSSNRLAPPERPTTSNLAPYHRV